MEEILSKLKDETLPYLRKHLEGDFLRLTKVLVEQVEIYIKQFVVSPQVVFGKKAEYPIPAFYEWNFWEPTVQLAIKDFCRPGDVCFDVGANAGALTLLMSRLVGIRGAVCAFEASSRIVDKTLWNIVQGGCNNVQLFNRAVYSKSGENVKIYAGSHLNDSLYSENFDIKNVVGETSTISLDDFISYTNLVPKFVKMDIEGAEYDALMGASNMISNVKPILVLEQSPQDMRCHNLLTAAGYRAIDLATYNIILSNTDFDENTDIANVLFLHEEVAVSSPYCAAMPEIRVADLSAELFDISENGSRTLSEPFLLPSGRYKISMDFSASGTDNDMFAGVDSPSGPLFRYQTHTSYLARSYRKWIIDLDRPTPITIYLRYSRGHDSSLDFRGATIDRLSAFDTHRRPLID